MKIAARFAALALAVLVGGASASAFADTAFANNHPRRDQVNDRLQKQNHRINQQVREGELGRRQAARLHRADHHIRREERRFASNHNGTITPAEQARLNRQENRVSRQIGN